MKNLNSNITKAMASNIGIRIPFTNDEAVQFNQYVEEHTLHKGKFIKKLVLEAMKEGKK